MSFGNVLNSTDDFRETSNSSTTVGTGSLGSDQLNAEVPPAGTNYWPCPKGAIVQIGEVGSLNDFNFKTDKKGGGSKGKVSGPWGSGYAGRYTSKNDSETGTTTIGVNFGDEGNHNDEPGNGSNFTEGGTGMDVQVTVSDSTNDDGSVGPPMATITGKMAEDFGGFFNGYTPSGEVEVNRTGAVVQNKDKKGATTYSTTFRVQVGNKTKVYRMQWKPVYPC